MGVIADGSGSASDEGLEAEIDASGTADGVVDIDSGDRSIIWGISNSYSSLQTNDCSVVLDAWDAGAASRSQVNGFESGSMNADGVAQDNGATAQPYDNSQNAGLLPPNGGINVYSILTQVTSGSAFVQQGVYIDHYATVAQHYLPNNPVHYRLSSLASGNIQEAYIANSEGNGMKSIRLPLTEYDTGALHDITPMPSVPMGSNPLPISLILSSDMISVPYFIEETINGATDVILTFPMRKYSIYNDGTLTNQVNPSEPACVGQLNDGVDDGDEVNLVSLAAMVQDYPHNSSGSLCTNVGFVSPHLDVAMVHYHDYAGFKAQMFWGCEFYTLSPSDTFYTSIGLQRSVNVYNIFHISADYRSVFGTPDDQVFPLQLDDTFSAGWTTFDFDSYNNTFNYNEHSSIEALTELVGGLGSSDRQVWTGLPVIGFAAMSANIGAGQVGETIELIRKTNRD